MEVMLDLSRFRTEDCEFTFNHVLHHTNTRPSHQPWGSVACVGAAGAALEIKTKILSCEHLLSYFKLLEFVELIFFI